MRNRSLNRMNVRHEFQVATKESKKYIKKKKTIAYVDPTIQKKIKETSPFLTYFNEMLDKKDKEIKQGTFLKFKIKITKPMQLDSNVMKYLLFKVLYFKNK